MRNKVSETKENMEDVIESLIAKERKRKQFWGLFRLIVLTVMICYLLLDVLFGIAMVRGASMEPGIPDRSIVVYSRLNQDYNVQDVVIAKIDGKQIIKRIVSIEEDGFYLIGDNLDSSIDSRTFGTIDRELVKGRVIFVFHFL